MDLVRSTSASASDEYVGDCGGLLVLLLAPGDCGGLLVLLFAPGDCGGLVLLLLAPGLQLLAPGLLLLMLFLYVGGDLPDIEGWYLTCGIFFGFIRDLSSSALDK